MKLRLEHALLASGVESDVLVEIEDGWITSVRVLRESGPLSGDASPENVRNPRLTGETCT